VAPAVGGAEEEGPPLLAAEGVEDGEEGSSVGGGGKALLGLVEPGRSPRRTGGQFAGLQEKAVP
jgi:hypothetical protein